MYTRRRFLSSSAQGLALLGSGALSLECFSAPREHTMITILHTNDTHSRIDPFPMDGGKFQGMGGVAKRAALIENIKKQVDHVLLLDCGDILQGTPYFNYYNGEVEILAMNEMKYDVATIGNHDFDAGIERLGALKDMANFQIINANYDFNDTPLEKKINPYTIIQKEDIKIGIFGLGIELKGLVPDKLFGATKYLDPIKIANDTAATLKDEHKCSLIICLSHLGYKYENQTVSDIVLANNTEHIDIILGGHTHTFMSKPDIVKNLRLQNVIIHQVGWGGILLGRIDVQISGDRRHKYVDVKNIYVNY